MKYWLGSLLALGASALALAQDPAAQEDNIIAQDAHEQEEDIIQHDIDFVDADADMNGELSIEEAKIALPALLVEDANKDGRLNQQEVEVLLPELHFAGRGLQGGEAPIGETEFKLIVDTLRHKDVHNHP